MFNNLFNLKFLSNLYCFCMLCLCYSEKPCKQYLTGLSTILAPPHTLPLAGQMVYETGQFLIDFSLISSTSAVIILHIHLEIVNLANIIVKTPTNLERASKFFCWLVDFPFLTIIVFNVPFGWALGT